MEGVDGQVCAAGGLVVDGAEVRGSTAYGEGGHGGEEPLLASVGAAQGAEDDAVGDVEVFEDVADGRGDHGVRAHLDEDAVSGVGEAAHGGFEADGAAGVVVPVGGVEGGGVLDAGAGDGGVEGDLGGARADRCESGEQGVPDLLDLGAVGGVVHRDAAGPDAVAGEAGEKRGEGLGVAGRR